MLKINNLNINNKNKEIVEKYQDKLKIVEMKEDNTTINSYIEDIYKYLEYMESKNIKSALDIKYTNILDYLKYLEENNYKLSSITRKIVVIKLFHKYLSNTYKINDESIKIIMPKKRRTLPSILTIEEVDSLLDVNLDTPFSYRNKSMLELMYSSGLRVSELVNLKLNDIDLNEGYVRCMGKGSKERIVPVGENALYYLKLYINEYRCKLKKGYYTENTSK